MAELVEDLNRIQGILWAARMDAAGDRWHLDERVAPSLKALAVKTGESRLDKAAEETAKAGAHLAAADDSLRTAIGLVNECAPARVTADEHG